jgi:hypothetical protein
MGAAAKLSSTSARAMPTETAASVISRDRGVVERNAAALALFPRAPLDVAGQQHRPPAAPAATP